MIIWTIGLGIVAFVVLIMILASFLPDDDDSPRKWQR